MEASVALLLSRTLPSRSLVPFVCSLLIRVLFPLSLPLPSTKKKNKPSTRIRIVAAAHWISVEAATEVVVQPDRRMEPAAVAVGHLASRRRTSGPGGNGPRSP